MKKLKIHIEQYFRSYPKYNKLYFTEDGCCFLEEELAREHAGKKDITAFVVDREDKKPVELDEPTITLSEEEAVEKLKELNFEAKTTTVKVLTELAEAFGLTPEGDKKADYIKVLSVKKEELLKPEE